MNRCLMIRKAHQLAIKVISYLCVLLKASKIYLDGLMLRLDLLPLLWMRKVSSLKRKSRASLCLATRAEEK